MVIPESIGGYRLVAPVGQGRGGVVYRAVALENDQPVAVKIIPADKFPTPEAREKFLQEARAAQQLSHPHLRQLYEVGESDDQIYLAMEYLEGSTLKNLLVSGPLEANTALEWGAEIAEALTTAHAQGVVHGDLTPTKVFITQQGTVKVLDAGLWRLAVPTGVDLSQETNLQESGLPATAVAGLAPEQIRGQEPDAHSDVFGLGTLLYEMVTGRNPFADRNPTQSMYWVLHRAPAPPSRVSPQAPAALDAVLARALEKEPQNRYDSVAEVGRALRAVAAGEKIPAGSAKRVVVRLAAPFWLAIAVLLLLLVVWFAFLALTRP